MNKKITFSLIAASMAVVLNANAQGKVGETNPSSITQSIGDYDEQSYAGENSVMVGAQYGPYKCDITYKVRTYVVDGVTMMDVEIPTYQLAGTVMGNLTIGTYTVKGLTYDDSKGGYYKDYSSDGLSMHFKAERNGATSIDADYALSAAGAETILVVITDGKAKITNNFKPGAMPFPISAVMDQNITTGTESLTPVLSQSEGVSYNIAGQRVTGDMKGVVIKDGKKYIVR